MIERAQKKKKIGRRSYECTWAIGDVFAYRLESELAKERGLYSRFFLIQKVDERIWYPKHIVPIVYVKLTKDESLPNSIEEYNELEYVQTRFSKYEERFFPIDGSRPLEDIAEKSKLKYEVDEYGYLPHYRKTLIITSAKQIPDSLIYLGNYANAIPPKNEFIPHVELNISSVFFKKKNEDFEIELLNNYFGHNCRELRIYH